MKNISYLFLASILFFSNCSNDNGVEEMLTEPIKITEADLVGNWDFVSLEFEGEIYTECDDELRKEYYLLNLSLLDVTVDLHANPIPRSTLIFNTDCNKDDTKINDELVFNINKTKSEINIGSQIFKIISFKNHVIKLKLISMITNHPNGGIYTLKKRN